MKLAIRLALALALAGMLAMPVVAHAQSNGREFSSEPSPPPLPHSAQNPLGNPPPPKRPASPGPAGAIPGGNARAGLVGYPDSEVAPGPEEIDAPVTGYGNEALWDAPQDAGSTAGARDR